MISKRALFASTLISSSLILAACGGDDDNRSEEPTPEVTAVPVTYSFEVSVTNATNNQPLSPVAIAAFASDYRAWNIGSAASEGLAEIAESGSPATFIDSIADDAVTTAAGSNPVGPGGTSVYTIEVDSLEGLRLTVASMLVNTNDAFSGVTAWPIYDLGVGDSRSSLAPIYDAGSETNDELLANIPGPAGSGESGGLSDGRETNDFVTRHPGVVTQADGYSDSALNESHKFDNGAMVITVTRTE